jgi:maltooligosyltrehalose trehalohydrolase
MAVFRVWAPRAERVDLNVLGTTVSMAPEAEGWWVAEVAAAGAGDDYSFSLDGGSPFPDPRSNWQPQGVHAASRLVDHGAFRWSDAGFQATPLAAALVYELHVGTFTPEGTFEAAIARLDHLTKLGVTHIELMPVADFPGRFGWGYDGVALFAPRHSYAGPEGLKRLVDACHARGLAVILDVVYNHFGPSGNYLPRFGPYLSERHKTPWGASVNLDGPHSDEVRRFLCDNALYWFRDYHVDGLRLDAVHALVDLSAIHLLEQLATEVEVLAAHLGRNLILIAESDLNDPRVVRPREIGGYGIDAQWSDDFHHALHTVLTGERSGYYADFGSIADLATALKNAYVYAGKRSAFRLRGHGRPASSLSAHRFLGYSQTHDQVGNRALGDRLIHQCGLERARLAAALVLTAPFVPLLFQGEEFGATAPFLYFADFADDPPLSRAVSEGRRREFAGFVAQPEEIPDPATLETFTRSKLDWTELEREPHHGLLQWYRRLIRLRRQLPQLSDGRLDQLATVFSEADGWLVVERCEITIVVNFAPQRRTIPIRADRPRAILLATPCSAVDCEQDRISLSGTAFVILGPDRPESTGTP